MSIFNLFKRPEGISVGDAHEMRQKEGAILLDVREPGEYAGEHPAGAVNAPLSKIKSNLKKIPADRKILVICQSGHRSRLATEMLLGSGLRDVLNVEGGMIAWRNARLPTEK